MMSHEWFEQCVIIKADCGDTLREEFRHNGIKPYDLMMCLVWLLTANLGDIQFHLGEKCKELFTATDRGLLAEQILFYQYHTLAKFNGARYFAV